MLKRIIAILLILFSLLCQSAFAFEESVNVIIEIEDINSAYEVHKNICENFPETSDIIHIYDAIFNGFSVDVPYYSVELIKDVTGVKSVYLSEMYKVPDTTVAEDLINNDYKLFSDSINYTGKKTLVAVLDADFDLEHEVFKYETTTNFKIQFSDMENVYANNILLPEDKNLTTPDTWHSDKIPYYYDYADNDMNVSGTSNHGIGVASLIGGNSASITGTSPDTQLALFKIASSDNSISNTTVLKALDDAYKLDVDAINMSLGDTAGFYSSHNGGLPSLNFAQFFDKFKEKGVAVFVSVGNSSNTGAYYHQGYQKYLPDAETPDYGTLSSFAAQTNVVAVGALEQNRENIYEAPSYASYSSWGTTTDLKIAPDITYYGTANLAQTGNKYASKSGTSFSSPLSCGIYLSAKEYFKQMFPEKSNLEINIITEQALMSSAKVLRENNVPVSPRVQGAGYLSLEDAIATPALLVGDDFKSKVNLFDNLSNQFTFEFDIINISDKEITYNLNLELTTDDYETINNYNIVNLKPKAISQAEFMFDCGDSVTLSPGENKTINVAVEVPKEFIEENLKVFKNGFFLEGFVTLSNQDFPEISIPYMGFYGDWAAVPIFDIKNMYNIFGFYDNGVKLRAKNNRVYLNPYRTVIRYGTLRNIQNNYVFLFKDSVSNNNFVGGSYCKYIKKIYRERNKLSNPLKYFSYDNKTIYTLLYDSNNNKLNYTEGDYVIQFKSNADYANAQYQYVNGNITIDTTPPSVTSIRRTKQNNKTYLEVSAKDNYELSHISVNIDGVTKSATFNSAGIALCDITDYVDFNHTVTLYDYALNTISAKESNTSYLAGYNGETLLDVKIIPGILNESDANEYIKNFDSNVTSVKLFIWNNLKPILNYIEIPVTK